MNDLADRLRLSFSGRVAQMAEVDPSARFDAIEGLASRIIKRRRQRALVAGITGLVTTILVAGAFWGAGRGSGQGAANAGPSANASQNLTIQARVDAAVDSVILPPGSVLSASPTTKLIRPGTIANPDAKTLRTIRWYVAPLEPQSVIDFLDAHAPQGQVFGRYGSGTTASGQPIYDLQLQNATTAKGTVDQAVVVDVVLTAAGHQTAILVQGLSLP